MQGDAIREWRESAPFWEKHAPAIRAMFAPVTRALVEEAAVREGQAVLDVAKSGRRPASSSPTGG